ncbi:TetR/AcrR family transcriptional regulator [Luedemannella flava]|uniref:TetR/AcrR family transcriptional regulator n=1 Tax=Luedemannella flava TaxID=349316 RepID=A0ABP4YMK7_9ACTN
MAGMGLRERRREELLGELRAIARRQLTENGAAALSLRAVAREAGIAVSALYRYFPDRDGLLTDLLVRAFDEQADEVEAAGAAAPDPAAAFAAGIRAYRRWSVAHPVEFGLAYGTPVPGYRAPAEQTVRAGTRVGDYLTTVLATAYDQGLVDRDAVERRAARLTAPTAEQLTVLRQRRGYGGPVALTALAMDAFVTVHGFVVMEVFGQLRPITPDAAAYFDEVVDERLRAIGFDRA